MSQILKEKHLFEKVCAKYPELESELSETKTSFILMMSFGLLNNIDSNRVKEFFDDFCHYLDVYFFPNSTCSILYVNELDKLDTIVEFIKNKRKRKLTIKYLKTDFILQKIKQYWLDSYNKFDCYIIQENSSTSDLFYYFSNLIENETEFECPNRIPNLILSILKQNGVQFDENHKIYVKMHSNDSVHVVNGLNNVHSAIIFPLKCDCNIEFKSDTYDIIRQCVRERSFMVVDDSLLNKWNITISNNKIIYSFDKNDFSVNIVKRHKPLALIVKFINDGKLKISNPNDVTLSSSCVMKNHVYDFYDTTSIHFSATRYSPWKKVMEYLSNLPNYSLVLDLGCANGKYFSKYEHFMIGCDICLPLLLNCDRSRVFRDNAIDISLRQSSISHLICIAVFAHFFPETNRIMLLSEIIRLLRINGTAMISFWAVEANDNKALAKSLSLVMEGSETTPSDLLVPWTETSNQTLNTQSTKYRYYHLYEHSEIVKLCEIFKSKIKIQDLFLDCGNWFLIIKKHSI